MNFLDFFKTLLTHVSNMWTIKLCAHDMLESTAYATVLAEPNLIERGTTATSLAPQAKKSSVQLAAAPTWQRATGRRHLGAGIGRPETPLPRHHPTPPLDPRCQKERPR
jgi:hypothetical protein